MAQSMITAVSTTCKIDISTNASVEIFLKNDLPKITLRFGNPRITLDYDQFEQIISITDKIQIAVLLITNNLKVTDIPDFQPRTTGA